MSEEFETWKTKVFNLDERIEELEKKINERTSIGGKFINKVVEDWFKDITLTPLGREIAELKERFNKSLENNNFLAEEIAKAMKVRDNLIKGNREVLRIIIKDVSYPWFTEYEKKNLLSLLDAPQTEKKELYKCDECEYYNGTSGCWAIKGLYDQTHPKCTFKRKDSGGEG